MRNTTSSIDGGLGQPKTPYWGRNGKKVRKKKKNSDNFDDDSNFMDVVETWLYDGDSLLADVPLNEVSYKKYSKDKTKTDRKKINDSVSEISKDLRKIEQIVNNANKLRKDKNIDVKFWKRTQEQINSIDARFGKLSFELKKLMR
jgi:uncharacterized lipoprotein YehR (DUF1307 family)